MKVTAVLVSHNGARWLPGTLTALERSSVLPSAIAVVDTGSTDDSVSLLEATFGPIVTARPANSSYADAVRAALATLPAAEADEWVWLLHDDSAPDAECPHHLLEAARYAAGDGADRAAVFGPKQREWPSLRRLVEAGITISGTGRRETGLEPGEYDQGQHDEEREVLAVNTAGMLVRRAVLEEIGLDDRLPLFGNDVDFGWRAALAGHRTRVVPDAVMFHAEAAHRGQRDSALAIRPRREERAAADYTLLVNGPGWAVPLRAVRLLLGGLLRAIGLLLVRAVGEARDEVAALARVLGHPGRVLAGRRARRGTVRVPRSQVRPLLAPPWLPYRHGLDFVTDTGVAVAGIARDEVRRRSGRDDAGISWLLVRSPTLWTFVVGVVLALAATRGAWFGAPLHGGALLPAPGGVGHWWSAWASGWHWLGAGSNAAGPAYLFPMALLGSVLAGSPAAVVWLLFVLGVPLTMLGAHHFLRRLVGGAWVPAWGALTYGLVPVVLGAAGQGRLGTVAGAMVLPWLAAAALRLGDPDDDRRRRATWRAALSAGLLVAFVPPGALLVVALVVVGAITPALWGARLHAGQLVALIVTPLVLVLPWAVQTVRAPSAWLVEGGRAGLAEARPDVVDLVLGRAVAHSAPAWIGVGLPLAALAALLRRDTRPRVARAWAVVLAAAGLLVVQTRVEVHLPGIATGFGSWPGFAQVVVQGAFIAAAAIAARGLFRRLSEGGFGWRQPIAAVAFVTAVAAPVAGAVWWVAAAGDGPVHRHGLGALPDYMSELAEGHRTGAVLVLRGGHGARPVHYVMFREGQQRLGDDGIAAMTAPDRRLTVLVQHLLASAGPDDAARLAQYGVAYVYAPARAAQSVSGAFDAAPGFSGASAPDKDARAWRVDEPRSLSAVRHDPAAYRLPLALLSALGWLIAVVLALPSRRRS